MENKKNISKEEHSINATLVGDDANNFNDWNFIEPQLDKIKKYRNGLNPGHVYANQEINKINGAIYLDPSKYKITEKDRLEWAEDNKYKKKTFTPEKILRFKSKLEKMIKNARNNRNLNRIGRKINYATNNKMYGIGITDLQIQASKKMREVYDKRIKLKDTKENKE